MWPPQPGTATGWRRLGTVGGLNPTRSLQVPGPAASLSHWQPSTVKVTVTGTEVGGNRNFNVTVTVQDSPQAQTRSLSGPGPPNRASRGAGPAASDGPDFRDMAGAAARVCRKHASDHDSPKHQHPRPLAFNLKFPVRRANYRQGDSDGRR